jgi:hypothetical protein
MRNMDLRQLKASLENAPEIAAVSGPNLNFELLSDPNRPARGFSFPEFKGFLASESSSKFRNFMEFLVWSDVKAAEALRLDWKDVVIDAKNRFITVAASDLSQRKLVLAAVTRKKTGYKRQEGKIFPDMADPLVTRILTGYLTLFAPSPPPELAG